MIKPTVSVVVPIFNADNYLKQCIESILSQTFTDFEIICVDDGSTDRSLQIINDYQKQDGRIKILHQNNKYAGVARNNGLQQAVGKYVIFLDSDDFFSDNLLKETINRAESIHTDIVVFNGFYYNDDTGKITDVPWLLRTELIPEDVFSADYCPDYIFNFTTPAPWNKLYLRDFLTTNNLQFHATKRANDLYFTYSSLVKAKRIAALDSRLIYYRTNNGRSLQGTNSETALISYHEILKLKSFLILEECYERYERSFINMCFSNCLYSLKSIHIRKLQKEYYKILREEIIEQLDLNNRSKDYLYFNLYNEFQEIKNKAYEEKYFNINYAEILSKMELFDKVIIYGAGNYAGKLIDVIKEMDLCSKILGIAVSNKKDNPNLLRGITVFEISELKRFSQTALVIIAVQKAYHTDISEILETMGFIHIIH